MEKRIATVLSRIFNPMMMAIIFMVVTLNLQFYFSTSIPVNAKWMILGLTAITTLIIPALLSNILRVLLKNRAVFSGRDARLLPLAVSAAFYLFTYHLFDRINLTPIFNLFILGMASLAVISMVWILFRDVSIYMVSAGALLGGFTGLHLTLQVNLVFFIILALLVGGLTGFSRLKLGKHKPVDIYTGYLAGIAVMLVHYLYL